MKFNSKDMKKGIFIVILSALVGGLTAFAVVKNTDTSEKMTVVSTDGSQYRTVNLSLSDYPDFTYAAESAVDAVVYVKVVAKDVVTRIPNSIFDFFFGYGGTPQEREKVGSGSGVNGCPLCGAPAVIRNAQIVPLNQRK